MYEHRFDINDTDMYVFNLDSGLELGREREINKDIVFIRQKYLANFITKVDALVEMYEDGTSSQYVRFTLEFADGETNESVILPFKGLGKVDWSNDIDRRCILNPDVPKAGEHIANVIRLQCAKTDVPTETMTIIDKLGTHRAEGIPVHCTGDELIWPSSLKVEDKPKVIFKPVPNMRLVVDPNCSERDADAAMVRIVDLSPDAGRGIFSLNLMCVQWEAFVDAGVTPRCNSYLHGGTGAKKTTYANFTCHHYNRDKPLERPDRLNASIPAAVKLLQKVRHGVLILDDLYPADSAEIRRQQEKTLLEVTRIIADGTEPARVRGGQVTKNPAQCGILGTGEYYVGDGSDAARLFPFQIKTPIETDKLTACQNEPLMLSTFYRYYIEWYITNFDEVVRLLKEWKAAYLAAKTGVHDRLQEMEFCLEAAYKLYLTYRIAKGFISSEEARLDYNSFYQQLREIVLEQNNRAKQRKGDAPKCQMDYLAIIRSMCRDRRLIIADSVRRFREEEHDGVIHKDYLYLRRDKLMARIRAIDSSAEFDDVILDLKRHQALKTSGHSTSKQLHGAGNGLRFYAIRLAKVR